MTNPENNNSQETNANSQPNPLKEQLATVSQQLETYLDPWQRGALILALLYALLITAYLLLKKEIPEPRELTEAERKKIETMAEERILKRAEFLKRLREQ